MANFLIITEEYHTIPEPTITSKPIIVLRETFESYDLFFKFINRELCNNYLYIYKEGAPDFPYSTPLDDVKEIVEKLRAKCLEAFDKNIPIYISDENDENTYTFDFL